MWLRERRSVSIDGRWLGLGGRVHTSALRELDPIPSDTLFEAGLFSEAPWAKLIGKGSRCD